MEDKIINLQLPLTEVNKIFTFLGEQKIMYDQRSAQINSLITSLQKQTVEQYNQELSKEETK